MLDLHDSKVFFVIIVLTASVNFSPASRGQDASDSHPEIRATIEADWDAQEKRLGRTAASSQAISARLSAAERLLDDLSLKDADLDTERAALKKLRSRCEDIERMADSGRLQLYLDIRWVTRSIAFKNPLVAGKRVLFMKRRRFICQMLHEYLGYYYDYEDITGGGIYRLENPGYSFAHKDLTEDRLGRGNYTTLALSYDARTIYFAFTERAEGKPDYYSEQRRCFHIYAM
ncbi:MAG: hypothetical protein ACYTBS_20650, partial [Planctomycetota bacterium]